MHSSPVESVLSIKEEETRTISFEFPNDDLSALFSVFDCVPVRCVTSVFARNCLLNFNDYNGLCIYVCTKITT